MKLYLFLLVIFIFPEISSALNVSIKGHVVSKNGEPLAGATVYIQEIRKGTTADFNGVYQFSEIAPGEYTIAVTFVGYEPQTRHMQVAQPMKNVDFVLVEKDIVLEGLVVTAQKREQSVKEIPTAITSLDANFLKESGITELDDLSEYVPGMQIQVQSPNNPGFVIRGITSDDGSSYVEPRVSVFQDGVSISKSRGSVVEVYDMERVEVLKGPQGTLFGRGAQIGAVHFIQNKAQSNTSGSITAGYGDYNYIHTEGFFNTPLVKDKLFARIAGIYKGHDGFIRNLSGGRLNGKDTKAFRASLRYRPDTKTNIDFIYNYQSDTPPGTSFKSGTYAPAGGDTKPWTAASLDKGKDLGLDRTVWGTTLIARHTFSPSFSLTSTTAYREFDSYESFDADGTAAPALWFAEDAYGKQFSQELRSNFKIGNRFEGFGGMSYFYEDGFDHVPFETNEQSLAVLYSAVLTSDDVDINSTLFDPINQALTAALGTTVNMQLQSEPLLTNGVPNYVSSLSKLISNSGYLPYIALVSPTLYTLLTQPMKEIHRESYTDYGTNSAYEFFADGTWHLTDWLRLTAGLRFTVENIESGYKATTDPDGNDGSLGFARSAGTNDLFMPTDKITDSDTYLSMVGRFAANFRLSKNLDAYASVSKGRRPNVIQFTTEDNGDYTSTYQSEKLSDEIVWSYETGMKGLSPDQRFYYDLAAYYYNYSHFQTQSIEDLQIITKDAGNATAYGFEASLKWQANRLLNIFGNYAFIHATFDDYDSNGNPQEYAGNTFRLTPKHSFALGFDQQVPLSRNLNAFVRPSYTFKSKVYFEEDNGDDVKQDAFGLFNLRAGLTMHKPGVSFLFFADNVLNKKYIIDAGNTGRNFGIPTYIAGSPSLIGFEMNYKF